MGITIDPNRDTLFDDLGRLRLKESYMIESEISPQERFAYVSKIFGSNSEHSQRLYDYSSKHWLSYSTPILSYGRSKRGLPISCYLNFINDTAEGLVENLSETNLRLSTSRIACKTAWSLIPFLITSLSNIISYYFTFYALKI